MNHFVYVDGLVGVETDVKGFKWNLGSSAPDSSYQEYSKCLIKIKFSLCNDKDCFPQDCADRLSFRHFYASKGGISFFQKVGPIRFGYSLSVDNNDITITAGKNYYRWIKYEIMNVHPIWYVLYETVACLLLKNGMTILYASAVETDENEATVFMGAPGSGKTYTAMQFCRTMNWRLISEDLLITDGQKVWPVPYTNTFRGNLNKNDVVFANGSKNVNRIMILEAGRKNQSAPTDELFQKAKLLNRYNVRYYSSPTMIAYNYFYSAFSLDDLQDTEERILQSLFKKESYYMEAGNQLQAFH